MGIAERSSPHRPGLFRAPFDVSKGSRARSQAKGSGAPAVTPRPAPTPVDVVKDSQATPARGRRSRSAAKAVDGGNEVVAEPKTARKRGSRSRVASPKLEQV